MPYEAERPNLAVQLETTGEGPGISPVGREVRERTQDDDLDGVKLHERGIP